MDRNAKPVICVDLDGTLLATDTLAEAILRLLHLRPWVLLLLPWWLLRGRANLKVQVAARISLTFDTLPVHEPLIDWLRSECEAGAVVWLCTGAPKAWALAASRHFDLFSGVLCSDDGYNLTGRHKAHRLVEQFGDGQFVYCGNEAKDLQVWRHARLAVVTGPRKLADQARMVCPDVLHFEVTSASPREWLRALRVHQWAKNLLVFVPLLAAHRALDIGAWWGASLAFGAFCLAASAVYLVNDLLDLPSDRRHPQKRHRPLASGRLSAKSGMTGVVFLVLAAASLTSQGTLRFAAVLGGYVALTLAYSMMLKRIALLDTLVLAGLYTLRLLAGAVVVQVGLSFWLLACSGFLFFSLALVKRSAELRLWSCQGEPAAAGRGYYASDLPLVDMIGIASGLLSVLVLALYMNSTEVRALYLHPSLLWGLCPLLAWWICRVWLLVHRGLMHDDPVVFALSDRASLAGAAMGALLVWAAT